MQKNKMPVPTEAQEQMTLFSWAAMQSGKYPELNLLYHVPNGGSRHKAEAGRLRAEGVKAGVPDLYAETLAFGSKINTNANLKYGTDYDLGDRVTCINKRWNVRIDVRITEIAETYETSGEEIDITFGESLPALLTQIRQITK